MLPDSEKHLRQTLALRQERFEGTSLVRKMASASRIAPTGAPSLYHLVAPNISEEDMTSRSAATFNGSLSNVKVLPPRARVLGLSDTVQTVVTALLSVFVFILPTDLRFSGDKSAAMRVGYLCVCLGVLGVIKRRSINVPFLGSWCLLTFVIWSTCSIAWARYPAHAVHKAGTYWILLAIAAVIPQYAGDRQVRMRLFDAYIAGCWCGALGVFIRYASGMQYAVDDSLEFEGRYSFGTDPNYLALALVIGVPLACYRAAAEGTLWKKRIFQLYVPAAFAAMVLTGSRGASIALLGAVLAFGIFTTIRLRAAMLAGAALCLLLALALPSDMMGRFASIPDELNHGTLSDRRDLWDRGTALVQEHPLIGIGAGATAGVFAIAAHNTPLELLMEGGVVSFVLFYGAFAFAICRIWKVERHERLVLLVVCVTWVVGTCSLSWEVDTVTWFILAILFSAGSVRKTERVTSGMQEALPAEECA